MLNLSRFWRVHPFAAVLNLNRSANNRWAEPTLQKPRLQIAPPLAGLALLRVLVIDVFHNVNVAVRPIHIAVIGQVLNKLGVGFVTYR